MSDPGIAAYMRGCTALKEFAPEMGPIQRTALVQTVVDAAMESAAGTGPFKTAVLTIIKAMQSYLPPDSGVSKDQFIAEVIGAVDNPAIFAALHGTSDAVNDSLKRALERRNAER